MYHIFFIRPNKTSCLKGKPSFQEVSHIFRAALLFGECDAMHCTLVAKQVFLQRDMPKQLHCLPHKAAGSSG